VLRRALKIPDNSGSVTDAVIAAALAADATTLIVAICDERNRFMRSLKTWPVFGAGWGRRVSDVKSVALAMAARAPAPATSKVLTQGRAVVPMAQTARHASTGAIIAAGAAATQQAHQSGMRPIALAAIVIGTVVLATLTWLFWHWQQHRQQQASA
jgi:lysozyme family protein